MMHSWDLDIVQALWELGLLPIEDVPAAAISALQQGHDSPAMRELAGLTPLDVDEGRMLFQRALAEQGRPELSKAAALRRLSDHVAKQIIDSQIEPYDGAKLLWRAVLESDVDHGHELDPFIYAASEYEDRPEDRDFFRRAIVQEARELITRRERSLRSSE